MQIEYLMCLWLSGFGLGVGVVKIHDSYKQINQENQRIVGWFCVFIAILNFILYVFRR